MIMLTLYLLSDGLVLHTVLCKVKLVYSVTLFTQGHLSQNASDLQRTEILYRHICTTFHHCVLFNELLFVLSNDL